ncbi:AGAP003051-PB [Anopheles gambiae str. PEST]|uniref:AGAP003051-PB n=1 Tax=Anopheles gambiae TaxID=7165 RepID=F5HK89_ANOGA|nr:AGAP003051-PB [Anopheles gambiae str. PEST]
MAPNVSDSDRAAGTVWQRAKGRPQDTINDQNNNDACQSGSSSNHCDQGASVPPTPFRARIRWPDLFAQLFVHGGFLIGLYYLVTFQAKFYTYLWTLGLVWATGIGITAGAHRLWSHKSYKARWPLRLLLMFLFTICGQDFMHAQVFANIRKLSPRQEQLLAAVDMSDLEADGIVMFQRRFYWAMYLVLFVLLPINAPLEYWGDTVQAAIFVAFSLRYLVVLNVAWLINSAHFVWGLDKNHKQSDSNMVFLVTKSYWPQYHYLLPFDYQSGEFGNYGSGCTTAFIRIFAAIGQATKLQTITTEAVKRGLTMAVDSGRPIVECLKQAGAEEMCNLKREHYLETERLH